MGTSLVLGRQRYHYKHEPCLYAVRKGCVSSWRGDRKQTTVWDATSPTRAGGGSKEEQTDHPTQKPVLLFEKAILNHTAVGEYTYEPFGGSGTAIIACEKTGRRSLTMEIDPRYCDMIIQRWQNYTGQEAVNSATGATFNQEVDDG